MVQASSTINFVNRGLITSAHLATNNKLLITSFNNLFLAFPTPNFSKFDLFNNYNSGYKLTTNNYNGFSFSWVLSNFIHQWSYIAFRGKSFRVRNFCRFNKFTLNFGYSHWTKLILNKKWFFFKRRRQRYIIITYNIKDFKYFSRFFPRIKIYNCYTMRGLRLRKQAIIRRFGKISQHISILH